MTLLEHHDARVGWGGEGNRVSQQLYASTNRADAMLSNVAGVGSGGSSRSKVQKA